MPRLSILIPDGESPFALHVLACLARNRSLSVHLISTKAFPLARFSGMKHSFHLLKQGQSLLEGVADVRKKRAIDLCMPVDTNSIYYFAQCREQAETLAKLSMIESTHTFRTVWDKGLLADFLLNHHLPHPYTITSREQFEKEGSSLGFPVLIKPRLAGGGTGIEKFTERAALLEKIGEEPLFFEHYIIQQYVDGGDIDCSVLCKDGRILAYTIQKGLYASALESFQAPDAIEFLHHPEVLQVTSELMAALGWNGVAHVDLRRQDGDGRIVVIEVNPRFWGSLEGSLHAGVNFAQLAIQAGLGETFPLPEYADIRYASALSAIKRKLRNKPAVELFRETNLGYYFRDPLPVFARLAGVD
jgi:D-aspartate ligase